MSQTQSSTEEKKKRLYVGNLEPSVTREDLSQLFGLETTPYLRKECQCELVLDDKGKSKGFAFVTVPEHVHVELMNLNGIEFYNRQLVIEESKTDSKTEGKSTNKPRGGGSGRGRGGRKNWNPRRGNRFNLPNIPDADKFDLIDCGANLTNPKFHKGLENVFARLQACGVTKCICTGLTANGCKNSVLMSEGRKGLCFSAVGIHPHFVKDDWSDNAEKEIREHASRSTVIAIGETGIDKHRNYSELDLCIKAFKAQVQIAIDVNKPLLVHERESHTEVMNVLNEKNVRVPVVIHCFTGSVEHLEAYIKKGYYIGVTGFICKGNHGASLRDAVKNGKLPLNRIILQSDAPYMMPNVPQAEIDPVSKVMLDTCFSHNEPCTLPVIVRTLAKVTGKGNEEVARICNDNARTVFGKI